MNFYTIKMLNFNMIIKNKSLCLSAFVVIIFFTNCSNDSNLYQNQARGYAQGTTYEIKYLTENQSKNWQNSFDSIFNVIDESMSTYRDNSLIQKVNIGDTLIKIDFHFKNVLKRSIEIAQETDGLFDPTVGPLVRAWGFGPNGQPAANLTLLDSIKGNTGFQKIKTQNNSVKIPKGFSLDFNAIAQGYTVDVLCDFIDDKKVENYYVEVGGETRCKGVRADGQIWRIGIDKPVENVEEANRIQAIIELKNKALATSGNYRKFYVDTTSGERYSHTINPKTGRPAQHNLLSISIITENCMDADAYATACMVMGAPKALKFLESKEDLEGYLIIAEGEEGKWKVLKTSGFKKYLLN